MNTRLNNCLIGGPFESCNDTEDNVLLREKTIK